MGWHFRSLMYVACKPEQPLLLVHDHFPGYYSQSLPAECHTVYVSFLSFPKSTNKPRLVSLPHLKIKLSVCLSLSSYSASNSFISFLPVFRHHCMADMIFHHQFFPKVKRSTAISIQFPVISRKVPYSMFKKSSSSFYLSVLSGKIR